MEDLKQEQQLTNLFLAEGEIIDLNLSRFDNLESVDCRLYFQNKLIGRVRKKAQHIIIAIKDKTPVKIVGSLSTGQCDIKTEGKLIIAAKLQANVTLKVPEVICENDISANEIKFNCNRISFSTKAKVVAKTSFMFAGEKFDNAGDLQLQGFVSILTESLTNSGLIQLSSEFYLHSKTLALNNHGRIICLQNEQIRDELARQKAAREIYVEDKITVDENAELDVAEAGFITNIIDILGTFSAKCTAITAKKAIFCSKVALKKCKLISDNVNLKSSTFLLEDSILKARVLEATDGQLNCENAVIKASVIKANGPIQFANNTFVEANSFLQTKDCAFISCQVIIETTFEQEKNCTLKAEKTIFKLPVMIIDGTYLAEKNSTVISQNIDVKGKFVLNYSNVKASLITIRDQSELTSYAKSGLVVASLQMDGLGDFDENALVIDRFSNSSRVKFKNSNIRAKKIVCFKGNVFVDENEIKAESLDYQGDANLKDLVSEVLFDECEKALIDKKLLADKKEAKFANKGINIYIENKIKKQQFSFDNQSVDFMQWEIEPEKKLVQNDPIQPPQHFPGPAPQNVAVQPPQNFPEQTIKIESCKREIINVEDIFEVFVIYHTRSEMEACLANVELSLLKEAQKHLGQVKFVSQKIEDYGKAILLDLCQKNNSGTVAVKKPQITNKVLLKPKITGFKEVDLIKDINEKINKQNDLKDSQLKKLKEKLSKKDTNANKGFQDLLQEFIKIAKENDTDVYGEILRSVKSISLATTAYLHALHLAELYQNAKIQHKPTSNEILPLIIANLKRLMLSATKYYNQEQFLIANNYFEKIEEVLAMIKGKTLDEEIINDFPLKRDLLSLKVYVQLIKQYEENKKEEEVKNINFKIIMIFKSLLLKTNELSPAAIKDINDAISIDNLIIYNILTNSVSTHREAVAVYLNAVNTSKNLTDTAKKRIEDLRLDILFAEVYEGKENTSDQWDEYLKRAASYLLEIYQSNMHFVDINLQNRKIPFEVVLATQNDSLITAFLRNEKLSSDFVRNEEDRDALVSAAFEKNGKPIAKCLYFYKHLYIGFMESDTLKIEVIRALAQLLDYEHISKSKRTSSLPMTFSDTKINDGKMEEDSEVSAVVNKASDVNVTDTNDVMPPPPPPPLLAPPPLVAPLLSTLGAVKLKKSSQEKPKTSEETKPTSGAQPLNMMEALLQGKKSSGKFTLKKHAANAPRKSPTISMTDFFGSTNKLDSFKTSALKIPKGVRLNEVDLVKTNLLEKFIKETINKPEFIQLQ